MIFKVMKSGKGVLYSHLPAVVVKTFSDWKSAHDFLMAQNDTNWWWWIKGERD